MRKQDLYRKAGTNLSLVQYPLFCTTLAPLLLASNHTLQNSGLVLRNEAVSPYARAIWKADSTDKQGHNAPSGLP